MTECATGKRRYRGRHLALNALASTFRARAQNGNRHEVRCYECPVCYGWHLTSQLSLR